MTASRVNRLRALNLLYPLSIPLYPSLSLSIPLYPSLSFSIPLYHFCHFCPLNLSSIIQKLYRTVVIICDNLPQ